MGQGLVDRESRMSVKSLLKKIPLFWIEHQDLIKEVGKALPVVSKVIMKVDSFSRRELLDHIPHCSSVLLLNLNRDLRRFFQSLPSQAAR